MSGSIKGEPRQPRRAIVVMGVSASGKTMAGEALARLLGLDFVDGDDLHPAANVAKMKGGTPLTDEDRGPWLDRIGGALADRAAHPGGLVIACSALRRCYRDRIRASAGPGTAFVFLDITREEAERRIADRRGHFMPPSLIESQFATLERPGPDESSDVVTIRRLVSPAEVAQDAADELRRRPTPVPL